MPRLIQHLLFSGEPVSRKQYLRTGVVLMLVKYGVDALAYAYAFGAWWHPLKYLNPVYGTRMRPPEGSGGEEFFGAPPWLLAALLLWGLLFAWIGAVWSGRRADDAGRSPWWGLWFFVPVANYVLILVLLLMPSERPPAERAFREERRQERSAKRIASTQVGAYAVVRTGVLLALLFVALFALIVQGYGNYGVFAFLALPVFFGTAMGWRLNRPVMRTRGVNTQYALLSTTVACSGLLLFAFEGIICLAMAFPLVYLGVWIGTMMGRTFAETQPDAAPGPYAMILLLPVFGYLETRVPCEATREVVSEIVIDAPPDVVWEHVVSFAELPEPDDWWFHTGLAYPMRARIDGEGVGAVRYCEFSTGAFVEPITVWDEPRRLAFDVVDQPVPMEEWSFYEDVSPPHLHGTFQSVRGEFRLIELDGGRTRLEGSTWYTLDMAPAIYWQLWSDAVIHRIHDRVLRHVRDLSEASARER